MGYRDWLALNTQIASAFLYLGSIKFPTRCQFLTLYSPYGANASLNYYYYYHGSTRISWVMQVLWMIFEGLCKNGKTVTCSESLTGKYARFQWNNECQTAYDELSI